MLGNPLATALTGTATLTLTCPSHGPLGQAATPDEANAAAAAHLHTFHADASGKAAPDAQVFITAATQVTGADVVTQATPGEPHPALSKTGTSHTEVTKHGSRA